MGDPPLLRVPVLLAPVSGEDPSFLRTSSKFPRCLFPLLFATRAQPVDHPINGVGALCFLIRRLGGFSHVRPIHPRFPFS